MNIKRLLVAVLVTAVVACSIGAPAALAARPDHSVSSDPGSGSGTGGA